MPVTFAKLASASCASLYPPHPHPAPGAVLSIGRVSTMVCPLELKMPSINWGTLFQRDGTMAMSGHRAKENEARRTFLDIHPTVTSAIPFLTKGGPFRELSGHVIIDGMLMTQDLIQLILGRSLRPSLTQFSS